MYLRSLMNQGGDTSHLFPKEIICIILFYITSFCLQRILISSNLKLMHMTTDFMWKGPLLWYKLWQNCLYVCCVEALSAGMGLWTLLEGFLLLANALAILNEDRFLAPRGWSFSDVSGVQRGKSLKGQLIGLIYATQYLRVPLIVLNAITILVKLVSGWLV